MLLLLLAMLVRFVARGELGIKESHPETLFCAANERQHRSWTRRIALVRVLRSRAVNLSRSPGLRMVKDTTRATHKGSMLVHALSASTSTASLFSGSPPAKKRGDLDRGQSGQRAYEKVGFRVEGRLRQHTFREGRYWDVLFMGLLREDWESSHGPRS